MTICGINHAITWQSQFPHGHNIRIHALITHHNGRDHPTPNGGDIMATIADLKCQKMAHTSADNEFFDQFVGRVWIRHDLLTASDRT